MGNKAGPGLLSVGSDRSPSRAREDYVKAIYQLGGGRPVRAADLARYLHVSRVAVSKAKRLLENDALVETGSAPAHGLRLTRRGRALAVAMVRRHRLLETFLHRSLHVPLERIHAEAERIEHVISDDVALRIADLLGRPSVDPHGHPIPYGDDERAPNDASAVLSTSRPGSRVRVVSLDDRDEAAVGALAAAGVLPGVELRVENAGRTRMTVRCGRRTVELPLQQAAMVRVAT